MKKNEVIKAKWKLAVSTKSPLGLGLSISAPAPCEPMMERVGEIQMVRRVYMLGAKKRSSPFALSRLKLLWPKHRFSYWHLKPYTGVNASIFAVRSQVLPQEANKQVRLFLVTLSLSVPLHPPSPPCPPLFVSYSFLPQKIRSQGKTVALDHRKAVTIPASLAAF